MGFLTDINKMLTDQFGALGKLGHFQAVQVFRRFQVDRHARFRAQMELYLETHDALRPLMHRMAARSRANPLPA